MKAKSDIAIIEKRVGEVAALLKLLSHPHRLLIACELRNGEASVGALEERVGAAQSNLSRDLARMKREGLVAARRESKLVYYRLADNRLARVVDALCAAFGPFAPAKRKKIRK